MFWTGVTPSRLEESAHKFSSERVKMLKHNYFPFIFPLINIDFCLFLALLQHGADSKIFNTDGKTAYDLAEPIAKSVLSGI